MELWECVLNDAIRLCEGYLFISDCRAESTNEIVVCGVEPQSPKIIDVEAVKVVEKNE